MYLALVRNQCFYKIHKRKTSFFAEEPNDTFASFSLSLLFGPISFLKLLESEGESLPPSLKRLFYFFLFALYDQEVWGGKHRFSSPDGNAFADNELRRGMVFGLKAPSTSPQGRVWFFGRQAAPRRNLEPGRPGGRRGQRRGRAVLSRGLRGRPAAWLTASAPQGTLAASLRGRSCLWTPRVEGLRPQGIDSPSQAARDKINQPGPPPPARAPAPALTGAFCLGVCVECFYVLAPRRSGVPPRACPPEAPPAEPFLPPSWPRGRSGGRKWGGRAAPRPGGWRAAESAGPVVSGAHYLWRIVDVAVVRAYAAGRPGSGTRDLRGGCGSRPFSNLIGLVVMWSAEASTITRGMFS